MTDATDDLDWQEYKMINQHNYLLQQRGKEMSDTIEVVVEKIAGSGASAGKAFVTDKVWYNFKKGRDAAKLPSNIVEGATITILDPYVGKTGSVYFTKYEVSDVAPVAKAAAKPVYKGKPAYGGNDDAKQRLIVRQNALTNTCNLIAAGKINMNSEMVAQYVDMFTNIVFEAGVKDEEEKPVEKKAASKPPVTKKKAEPVVTEDEEEDYDESDDPYAV